MWGVWQKAGLPIKPHSDYAPMARRWLMPEAMLRCANVTMERAGQSMHHLIDPRTGTPAQTDILSATVIAPSAQQADIAAKVWLILGSANGTQWLESQQQLAGLAVLEDGTIVRSSQFNQYVWP